MIWVLANSYNLKIFLHDLWITLEIRQHLLDNVGMVQWFCHQLLPTLVSNESKSGTTFDMDFLSGVAKSELPIIDGFSSTTTNGSDRTIHAIWVIVNYDRCHLWVRKAWIICFVVTILWTIQQKSCFIMDLIVVREFLSIETTCEV